MEYAVEAEGLRKRYGERDAVDGLDLTVRRGTVCGLLGPNGAGKTTTVRILSTLIRADGGRARVGGVDVATEPREVRRRIGLAGQNAAVDELLTARQNLVMFGRLFHLDRGAARRRASELLERFALADAADLRVRGFSGGMRRRLDLASSMILSPEVLFFDEPTTGLDPRGRREVWDAVRDLAAGGTTVLLTTHYLDEADQLSDRIAVIDHGRLVVEDTPAALKRRIGGDRLEVVVHDPADLPAVTALLERVTGRDAHRDEPALRVHAPARDRISGLADLAAALRDGGVDVADLGLRRASLDDVFLRLTGRPADSAPDSAPDSAAPDSPADGTPGASDRPGTEPGDETGAATATRPVTTGTRSRGHA